ncbi:MAG TPA: STAS domain-containing protein [Usitatibacter sp.]|nr:STAS domain-containing protein [Usitatibacter sp.]
MSSVPDGAAFADEVLVLEGALSFETLPAVLAQSAEYAARPDLPERLTIDFARITAVDSSAVALLLEWRRQALGRGKRLEFANLPPNLLALARLYGVAELIQDGAG